MNEQNNQIENFLSRIIIFLEDGEWEKADEYCEKVLDVDSKNAEAYFCKMMAQLKVKTREELSLCETPLEDNSNYEKVLKFGEESLVTEVKQCNQIIKERQAEIKCENAKRAKKLKKVLIITVASLVVVAAGVFAFIKFGIPAMEYKKALKLIEKEQYAEAYEALEELGDYKDCKKLLEKFTVKYETEICTYKDGSEYVYKYQYDKDGNEIKYISYDEDGEFISCGEYEYDKDGNEIKYIHYNEDGNVDYYTESQYDKYGNQIKYTSYDQDGNVEYYYQYEYDKNGNELKCTSYDQDGNVEYHYEREYDKYGNKIKEVEYESDVRTVTYLEYEYDKDGNATKCTIYDQYRIVLGHSEWEYDKNGNELKYIHYDKDGNVESQYEYDKNGKVLKCIQYDEDGNVEYHYEREYDKYGNMTKYILYGSDGEIKSKTEYKYKDPVWFYDLKEKEEK